MSAEILIRGVAQTPISPTFRPVNSVMPSGTGQAWGWDLRSDGFHLLLPSANANDLGSDIFDQAVMLHAEGNLPTWSKLKLTIVTGDTALEGWESAGIISWENLAELNVDIPAYSVCEIEIIVWPATHLPIEVTGDVQLVAKTPVITTITME